MTQNTNAESDTVPIWTAHLNRVHKLWLRRRPDEVDARDAARFVVEAAVDEFLAHDLTWTIHDDDPVIKIHAVRKGHENMPRALEETLDVRFNVIVQRDGDDLYLDRAQFERLVDGFDARDS